MWHAPALALLVALAAAMTLAPRAEALPASFWGVVPQTHIDAEQFERLERGGVESVRVTFDWAGLQPDPDEPIDWAGADGPVERAVRAGIDVLPTVTGAPTWAVPQRRVPGGGGAEAVAHLPASGKAASGWRNLLREAVLRYGPRGSFWSEHPELPRRPIRFWQIWNEPNFSFFLAKPRAAEYGKLVKLSYGILHRTDPGARIVLAGLFGQPKNCKRQKRPLNPCAADFLDEMYRKTPGIKNRFVGVALHPYSGFWQNLKPQVEEIRETLAEHGDASKGIWLTELGWSSKPPEPRRNVFAKGVNGQRNQLKGAFGLLERKQSQWRIRRVYWFSVEDLEDSCNFCDGSGLFEEGFRPKKSWYAFVRFAGGRAN
jgi:hypothetical protein